MIQRKIASAVRQKTLDALAPADGAAQLRRQDAAPVLGVGVVTGVDVGDDGDVGLAQGRLGERNCCG